LVILPFSSSFSFTFLAIVVEPMPAGEPPPGEPDEDQEEGVPVAGQPTEEGGEATGERHQQSAHQLEMVMERTWMN
jgi:hypothetical protein